MQLLRNSSSEEEMNEQKKAQGLFVQLVIVLMWYFNIRGTMIRMINGRFYILYHW